MTTQNHKRNAATPQTQAHVRRGFAPPALVDMDTLGAMPDAELVARHRAIDEDRIRVMKAGVDPRAWEEELAYSRREMQIRRTRMEMHDAYIAELKREHEEDRESEANLPAADLDNSHFLRVIGVLN